MSYVLYFEYEPNIHNSKKHFREYESFKAIQMALKQLLTNIEPEIKRRSEYSGHPVTYIAVLNLENHYLLTAYRLAMTDYETYSRFSYKYRKIAENINRIE